ncbi:hypothetical protein GCM10023115_40270 [Pontixanthobacter gangjinensis]|uniref:Uncharacterized protein n=1 Tax=Christiangramia aestuarii TaxID=1028746 RepID=A0A7K1LS56_9FLAO|nr:hypothetical protein [Christiangramia aestuarii]MUP43588.1 hypothetical protein [Christiangramia aestuarii]
MKRRLIFSCLISIILCACSKDDDPNLQEEPQGTLQGVFIDSPVSGLRYETETHSGYTDENGKFDYEEGETVTFFVGDIKLGSAPAAEEISPISIASTLDADINTLEVQNIAAFLQSLDEDGNPENGIQISQEVSNAISGTEIDFTQPLIQIMGEIILELFQTTGISLKAAYPQEAATHLAGSLGLNFEPVPSFAFNFLPTFTNYFGKDNNSYVYKGSSLALNWIHEFNDEGVLIGSTAYEKYPDRVLFKYKFYNYDNSLLKVDLEIIRYNYNSYSDPSRQFFTINYNEEFIIQEVIPQELTWNTTVFKELNDSKWIIRAEAYNRDGDFKYEDKFDYDQDGNLLNLTRITPNGDQIFSADYTYTAFGDLETYKYTNADGFRNRIYNYRENKTLEKFESTFSGGTDQMEFNEDEGYQNWTSWYDDGETIIYTYGEEKVEMDYYNDVLYYVYYYRFEEGFGYSGYPYKWEWFEDGILRERYTLDENYNQKSYEYFYDNGNLEYKDVYDEEGNWIYREYYDEDGNLTNTEYQ